MTDELKPCPFCGGEGVEILDYRERGWLYAIECLDCNASTGPQREKLDAIDAWNRRTGEEPKR